MTPSPPNAADAAELQRHLDAALAALPEVEHVNGYPINPPAVLAFSSYLSRSPWHRADYIADMKSDLRGDLETLALPQIRSYLTFLIRVDRFNPGGLLHELEAGHATRAVARARELT
ncbi:MAG: DUF6508 domain-containing protein [Verrucomicrobiales bacterium]